MSLAEFLRRDGKRVIDRWLREARSDVHGESVPRIELEDHMPSFLLELADVIARPTPIATAASHGEHRMRLGFSVSSVVHEYRVLYRAILDQADADRVPVTPAERDVLAERMMTAIADAVTEYALQRDAETQRQANESFAFIAHELRGPLSSAKLALALWKKKDDLSKNRFSGTIERALSRVLELIDAWLGTARLGAGIDLQFGPVKVRDLLEEAKGSSSVEAEEKSLHVRIDASDDAIEVDRRLIRSALDNLVRNAVKHTHDRGTVHLRAKSNAKHVTIEIEDECGGLPPGDVEMAFSPFVQMKPGKDGFGLGLAIAKQAVAAHDGSIRVQNLPGKGCIFALEIPMR